jgi:hypothetical protein
MESGKEKKRDKDAKECEREEKASDTTQDRRAEELKPGPRVGESEDNLKQRSDWFQKRRGNVR